MASQGKSGSRSSLFLVELIITIFFFSLAGTVCVRLFLYAHKISSDSKVLTKAVSIAQNAAESFLAADGDPQQFAELLSMTFSNAGSLTPINTDNIDTGSEGSDSGSTFTPKYPDIEAGFLLPLDNDLEVIPANSDNGTGSGSAACYASFVLSSLSGNSGTTYAMNIQIADAEGMAIYSLEVLDYIPSKAEE